MAALISLSWCEYVLKPALFSGYGLYASRPPHSNAALFDVVLPKILLSAALLNSQTLTIHPGDSSSTGGGYTPLSMASNRGHIEVVKLLCDADAAKDQARRGKEQ